MDLFLIIGTDISIWGTTNRRREEDGQHKGPSCCLRPRLVYLTDITQAKERLAINGFRGFMKIKKGGSPISQSLSIG